jgi:hypothetical protein
MSYFRRAIHNLFSRWKWPFPRRARCFSLTVRRLFRLWEKLDLLESLEGLHQELLDRRTEAIEFGEPNRLTPQKRTASNCRLLQQTLLHRSERLLVSSGTMLVDRNVYGLALIVRGHFECSAMLGYFCHRLDSLAAGNIKFEDFEWNVADAVMGAKHETFEKARDPLNVLTCIEKADKYLNKALFEEKKDMLQDCYDWLSEFAHPNFLSNLSAFALDKQNNQMILRYGGGLRREDFQLLEYLETSAILFGYLFDSFSAKVSEQKWEK